MLYSSQPLRGFIFGEFLGHSPIIPSDRITYDSLSKALGYLVAGCFISSGLIFSGNEKRV